jgi:hypothetical protein
MRAFLMRIKQDTGIILKIGQTVKFLVKEPMCILNQDGIWSST